MRLLIIDRDSVSRQLTFEACIPVIRQAMIDLSEGRTRQTHRQLIPLADGGVFGVMQGALGEADSFGVKALSVMADRREIGAPSHQGLVLLFDPVTGAPCCLAHAGQITAVRTAAASAVATEALSIPDAKILAVLGTGEQAAMHAEAIMKVRRIEEIRIWGRTFEKAVSLAQHLSARLDSVVSARAEVWDAVAGAAIICTTTSAAEPILESNQVADGAHINVVGSSYAGPAEIDATLVKRSRFFADHKPAVLAQGAEFLRARAAGLVDDDHILAEIGEVLANTAPGRETSKDVTIYKSLGNIVQDLASTKRLWELAKLTPGQYVEI